MKRTPFFLAATLAIFISLVHAIPVSVPVPAESIIDFSDIILAPLVNLSKSDEISLRTGVTSPDEIWSLGVIPYEINNTFSASWIQDIKRGMSQIQSQTCLIFRQKTAGDKYSIFFQNTKGYCASYVGRQTSFRPQPLWASPDCMNYNSMLHEVVHAVGFWHTQQRTDRDSYVTIDFNALEKGKQQGYITDEQIKSAYTRVDQLTSQNLSNYGVAYDYESIMHYPRPWGQISNVIMPKNNPPNPYLGSPSRMAWWWDAPKDQVKLSPGDVQAISKMYSKECNRRKKQEE